MTVSNVFERNPKKTIGLMLIIALTAMDIVAAQIYKLTVGHSFHQPAQISEAERLENVRVEKLYRIPSKIYHHDLKKNMFVSNANWGNIKYPVFTNSLGFKSKNKKKISLSSNKHRIVFIGDSFTEGVGVAYSDTFVGITANQLAGENIEVLNAAVVSYAPTIYWRKIKYLIEDVGLEFDELIVFIDISDIQDEAIVYSLTDSNTVERIESFPVKSDFISTIKRIIKNDTIIIHWVLDVAHDLIIDGGVQNAEYDINKDRSRWTIDETLFHEYGEAGLKKSAHFMRLLYDLLKKHRIKLLIGVYPWPDQIINNDLNSIQVTFWEDWAKERNVRFANFFPCFIKHKASKKARFNTLDTYFINNDVHWNEKGHQLIAESFLPFYRNKVSAPCAPQY